MPNTDPVTDNQAAVGFIVSQAQRAGKARVYPIGAVSLGQKGQQLAEFGELVGAGAVAVSDDGKPVVSSHLMRTALEYARTFGIPVADHCEDPTLAAGGAMHEGIVSTRLGLKGVPSAAEEIMVARDIILAELTGGHVHLCHMSTRGSVELIRRAKERGLRVTAEACPHHFSLTHEACEGYDTNAKMNPPLREPADRDAIREGLRDGTIDVIGTDHAPHHYDAKEREFDDAPNGIIGLETALGLAITELVEPGCCLAGLIRRMSTMPARIFNLPGGTLALGAPADIVVFDPAVEWVVEPAAFFSRSRNTPFAGRRLRGRAELTIVRGEPVRARRTLRVAPRPSALDSGRSPPRVAVEKGAVMVKPTAQSGSAIEKLLQDRSQYEQWLARLASAGDAPDAVRLRVRADYEARLRAVMDELRTHAATIKADLDRFRGSEGELMRQESAAEERIAEAEIRHAVGEFEESKWQEIRVRRSRGPQRAGGADAGALRNRAAGRGAGADFGAFTAGTGVGFHRAPAAAAPLRHRHLHPHRRPPRH